ncbi:PIN domain-containing protein [Actinomadura sp. NTSP31]|uniref:PIN domain-containing protein n=1 Tax=Actinomadura sp. NTSP31 TaxID=1735447 RepID=UPI0035BEB6C0
MLITLESGADRRHVSQVMRRLVTDAQNLAGSQHGPYALHRAYQAWVNAARTQLRRQISETDMGRLVLTDRYEALLSMQVPVLFTSSPAGLKPVDQPGSGPIREILTLEIDEHVHHFEQAIATLEQWSTLLERADRSGSLVIADANVFCHHPSRLKDWDVGADARALPGRDVHLVLPLPVLDELDRLKDRGQGAAKTNARETIKQMMGLLPHGVVRQRGQTGRSSGVRGGALTLDLWPDPPCHVRLPRADDEIIARAVAFQALAGRKVTLLTGDGGMSSRAELAGLDTVLLDLPDATHKPPKPPRGTQHPAHRTASIDVAASGVEQNGQ